MQIVSKSWANFSFMVRRNAFTLPMFISFTLISEPWPKSFSEDEMFDNLERMDALWKRTFSESVHDVLRDIEDARGFE